VLLCCPIAIEGSAFGIIIGHSTGSSSSSLKKASMKTHPLLPSCYLLSFGSFPTSLLPLPFFLAPFVATIYMELSLPTD